jgi:3-deoxy-D-glycero-D-galacto-nononate 9-phosphate synthase
MHTYIIGEIGQNHNGSVELAKVIIDLACRPTEESLFKLSLKPMDAVKLTKRDLKQELSASQMKAPYNSLNSFGETYGKHREALELNDDEHFEVYKYAKSKGIDFVETLCATGCLSILKLFTPDYLKVASRDLTNIPLLSALAETKIPIIISTGMAGQEQLDDALKTIKEYHDKISILHCVSQYPTEPQNVNLGTIKYLIKKYPQYCIGYSDHTIGISTPLAAVAMGARIIEKHITIDRRMKGTDQAGSLGPDGVNRMVRDIRMYEMSLGKEDLFIDPSVNTAKLKLERSIAAKREIKAGETLSIDHLHLLSPGDGIKWANREEIIGRTALNNIPKDEIIYKSFIN